MAKMDNDTTYPPIAGAIPSTFRFFGYDSASSDAGKKVAPGEVGRALVNSLFDVASGIPQLDASAKITGDHLPSSISARLSVWGGTELALNEEVPANRELLISDAGRLIVGDATRYGGEDFLRQNSLVNRIGSHVSGNVSMVSAKASGTIGITCTTSSGNFGVLWWDGTISTSASGGAVSKAVTSPTADWAGAPKLIQAFPVTSGATLASCTYDSTNYIQPAAIDLRGFSPTTLTALSRCSLTEFVCPQSVTTLGIEQSLSLTFLDISGLTLAGASTAIAALGCTALSIVRAVGTVGASGSIIDMQESVGAGVLSATAINRFFTDLGQGNGGGIYIYGHTGTAASDATIATAKGWTVTKTFV